MYQTAIGTHSMVNWRHRRRLWSVHRDGADLHPRTEDIQRVGCTGWLLDIHTHTHTHIHSSSPKNYNSGRRSRTAFERWLQEQPMHMHAWTLCSVAGIQTSVVQGPKGRQAPSLSLASITFIGIQCQSLLAASFRCNVKKLSLKCRK